jgi:hypothetical protein
VPGLAPPACRDSLFQFGVWLEIQYNSLREPIKETIGMCDEHYADDVKEYNMEQAERAHTRLLALFGKALA